MAPPDGTTQRSFLGQSARPRHASLTGPATLTSSLCALLVLALLLLLALVPAAGAAGLTPAGLSSDSPAAAQALGALLVAQEAQLTGADGAADDNFGWSIAISGDTAVVGAPYDQVGANAYQGSAYVFVRSGRIWSQQTQLTAVDGAAGDYFGWSVAISGDTVVVGAPYDDVGANGNQGAAYVFVRSGATWSQQQQLTAADGAAGDNLGTSVTISGNTVAVGAPYDGVGANADQGSAYVFVRSGALWSQQQQLIAVDGAALDYFGWSVAISGDTVVVGAANDDIGATADQGSAYVFVRSGAVWGLQAHVAAADGLAGDYFGNSVAISGDTVVVGAYYDDIGANADQGSAYVFVRSGTAWSQQAQLTAADGLVFDRFGTSVAISGDTVVAGAPYDDVGANGNQGSAYVFVRSGTIWSQQQLTAVDGAAADHFGYSVAIWGDTVPVGANVDDVGANINQGSAYVLRIAKPGRPAAKSPKRSVRGRTPSFRWSAAAGAAAYEVRIYKGKKLLKKQSGIVKTSWKVTKRLPRQAWLTWKVRARNVAGYGAWSAKLRFKVR